MLSRNAFGGKSSASRGPTSFAFASDEGPAPNGSRPRLDARSPSPAAAGAGAGRHRAASQNIDVPRPYPNDESASFVRTQPGAGERA